MNCPNTKHKKPVKLQRKRTLVNGRTVRRENYCPTCKQTVWSVELFEGDLAEERGAWSKENRELEHKYQQLEWKHHRLVDAITVVKDAATPGKK